MREDDLIELIEGARYYFCAPLDDVKKVAKKFIENFDNDKKLPWNSTPPVWLENAVYEILDENHI